LSNTSFFAGLVYSLCEGIRLYLNFPIFSFHVVLEATLRNLFIFLGIGVTASFLFIIYGRFLCENSSFIIPSVLSVLILFPVYFFLFFLLEETSYIYRNFIGPKLIIFLMTLLIPILLFILRRFLKINCTGKFVGLVAGIFFFINIGHFYVGWRAMIMGEFSGYLSLLAVSAICLAIYFVAARIHRSFPKVDRPTGQRKSLQKPAILAIGLCFVFLIWITFHTSSPSVPRTPGSKPSILLIVLDTARADRFSCYGYERDTTPFLKLLSEDATLYPETISPAAWTMPSHASIFTGLYPSAHGSTLKNIYLDDQFITLPEFLGSKGYVTVGISNNPIVNRENGLAQGFEYFIEMWKDEVLNPTLFHRLDWLLKRFLGQNDGGALRTNQWAMEWLNHVHRRDQPFFLFVNLMECHLWNNAPKSYHEMFLREEYSPTVKDIYQRNLCSLLTGYLSLTFEEWIDFGDIYDGDLYYLDRRIEELFQFLEEDSFLDEMIVVITSDHGEHLGEHGMIGHITSLYEPLVRVPLIVKVPEGLPKLPEVRGIVQTIDIYPTLIELLGFEDAIPDGNFQGFSLVGAERSPHEYAITEIESPESLISNFLREYPEGKEILKYDRALKSLRTDSLKYIWSSTGRHEFYNLFDDPEELINLIAEKSTEADELEKRLKGWLISFEHAGVSERGRELDAELRQELKDLGYIN